MKSMTRIGRRLFSSLPKSFKKGDRLNNFIVKDTKEIEELALGIVKLEHEPTGALHWHVTRDDPNCVFCIAFRTPPSDSTGVPHILEHTTLCGSAKYPVRDPFFKMLNRSLASYMNAWTASEHTAYPFCTANEADYKNLRDVYCDAVFRPKLSKLDFLQEGWRLENQDPKDPKSPLSFKGVVYNEMKGAFSDVENLFAQRLQQHRFPGTIYGHVSGGDPPNIIDLTHEELVEFHRSHYHPSNALIYTYGKLPLEETLEYLDGKLSGFTKMPAKTITVGDLPHSDARTIEVTCPLDPANDSEKQCKMILSFLLQDVQADPQETFHLRILSHLLLEGSSAPLYKALIDSNIGQDYAAGTGYATSTKLATFSVGLQGIKEESFEEVKAKIYEALKDCHQNGFPSSRIEAVLHLLELSTKHQPAQYGLSLSHRLISSWVYGLEPEAELAVNEKIARFKEAYAKGNLFEGLIEKYFLANKSPLTFIMKPSAGYGKDLEASESKLLAEKIESLSSEDRERIFKTNLELLKEQEKKENTEALPCLSFEDVKRETKKIDFKEFHHRSAPKLLWRSTASTNGISFVKTLIPIKQVSPDSLKLFPILCESLTELGVEGKTMERFDEETKLYTGGLSSSLFLGRQPWVSQNQPELALLVGTHALDRNVPKALELLQEAISKADFSNLSRLKTIISGNASSLMNSIASSGHSYAMTKAASALSKRGKIDEEISGLSQVHYTNDLDSVENLGELSEGMRGLAKEIMSIDPEACRTAVVSTNDAAFNDVSKFHESLLKGSLQVSAEAPMMSLSLSPLETEFIEMPFATNFAAKVFQFNPYNLKESAHLSVLAKILRSGLLHKEIREKGGAYGGGASYSTLNGTFSFYSYRDPNPWNSLETFGRAPAWFLEHALTDQELLEAKLSVFSALDAPVDLASEGLQAFYHGISHVDRQLYRDQVFAVDKAGLREVVDRLFLSPTTVSQQCVIGNKAK